MDIDRVIEILRESKRKSKCPPGFRYSKKMNMCVPTRKYKGKYRGIRGYYMGCLLYTSPSPRDGNVSRMPSSA